MTPIALFKREMEREALTTRKMLSRVPDDKFDWKPHSKSMSIKQLATHIADLPTWIELILVDEGIDFETSEYKPKELRTNAELMQYFEECLGKGLKSFDDHEDADLMVPWTIRSGETIFTNNSRLDELRNTSSQIVHHRAQLGVNLRLLDIPIPGSYGPSADEM